MGRVDEGFIILLEVNRVLSISDLAVLSKVTQSPGELQGSAE